MSRYLTFLWFYVYSLQFPVGRVKQLRRCVWARVSDGLRIVLLIQEKATVSFFPNSVLPGKASSVFPQRQ